MPPDITADRTRWQRQATEVLTRLLKLAAERSLPPINWTVTASGGVLHGECLSLPYATRRAELEAWHEAIGEPGTARETDFGDGDVRLTAVWEQDGRNLNPLLEGRTGWQLAQVVITARILPELDPEG